MKLQRVAITGICIGIVLIVIASLFKVLHWVGSVPLLVTGFSLLIVSYAFRFYLKNPKTVLDYSKLAVAVFAPLSYLFSLMHWPYGNLVSMVSLAAIVLFLFLYIRLSIKENNSGTTGRMLSIVASFGIVGGALFNVLHLPYAQYCMIGGMIALGALVVMTIFRTPESKDD